jgi:hypothetical protein
MKKSDELGKLRELCIKSPDDLIINTESPWIEPGVLADVTGTQ